MTPEGKIKIVKPRQYDLNLTWWFLRFYDLAPFTVFESFSHPFNHVFVTFCKKKYLPLTKFWKKWNVGQISTFYVYVIWMWIDGYWKYQPAKPEYEVCWWVSKVKRTSLQLHILSSRLIFFSINNIHIQMTCLSSLNQT